jgi:hypothetical protein
MALNADQIAKWKALAKEGATNDTATTANNDGTTGKPVPDLPEILQSSPATTTTNASNAVLDITAPPSYAETMGSVTAPSSSMSTLSSKQTKAIEEKSRKNNNNDNNDEPDLEAEPVTNAKPRDSNSKIEMGGIDGDKHQLVGNNDAGKSDAKAAVTVSSWKDTSAKVAPSTSPSTGNTGPPMSRLV